MRTNFWHRNASTVLTCLGGVGLVATTVLAVKTTPKALQRRRVVYTFRFYVENKRLRWCGKPRTNGHEMRRV